VENLNNKPMFRADSLEKTQGKKGEVFGIRTGPDHFALRKCRTLKLPGGEGNGNLCPVRG
jgi:hypothetical protein